MLYLAYLVALIVWMSSDTVDMLYFVANCQRSFRLSEVNFDKLKLLGFCHLLYQSLRKDNDCFDSYGTIRSSEIVQRRASGSFRALIPLIE